MEKKQRTDVFYYPVHHMQTLVLRHTRADQLKRIRLNHNESVFLHYAVDMLFTLLKTNPLPLADDYEAWTRMRQLITRKSTRIATRFLLTASRIKKKKKKASPKACTEAAVCPVCLESTRTSSTTSFACCQGAIHTNCFVDYTLFGQSTCPFCRSKIF